MEQKKEEMKQLEIINEKRARENALYEGKISFMSEWEGNGP